MTAPCPICKHRASARSENPAFPFCSERCRLIDLGRWLGEEYRVPAEQADPTLTPDDETPDGPGGPARRGSA